MNVPQMFGENVFNDAVQKETLPKEVYRALRATIESGKQLDVSIAGSVAAAMKDWADSPPKSTTALSSPTATR